MKKIYSLILVTIILSVFGSVSYSQDSIVVSSLQKDVSANTWHLIKQVNSVNIYFQYVDCGPVEYVNFKLENTSLQLKNVSWSFNYYNNSNLLQGNPDDLNVNLTLGSSEVKKGECLNGLNSILHVYVREGNLPLRLSLIELINLTVTN